MKTSHLTAVLTLTCLLGLGASARAADGDSVAVTVPFEFVAGAKVMPAGKYSIARSFPVENRGLVIRSFSDGVFLLPTVFDGFTTGHTKLSFEHVGDKYFLSKVETQAGVYSFPLPRATASLAQTKNNLTLSSSGGN
jgi:hypothetical protein